MDIPPITVGISCKGNIKALMMNLTALLTAHTLPRGIQIRLEGNLPGFSEFYLEQLADLARFRGVEFTMSIHRSTGVRDSRDWQIDHCPTTYLWMLDDDVIAHAQCLMAYSLVMPQRISTAFFAGSKMDVSNRRNYPHFSMKVYGKEHVTEIANHSLPYNVSDCMAHSAPTKAFDSGNVIFNVKFLREKNCRFRLHEDSANPSGDGTTFALVVAKAGLTGIFVPSAQVFHMEKENGGFNEFEARKEMLLRLCDLHGFDKSIIRDYFMPAF